MEWSTYIALPPSYHNHRTNENGNGNCCSLDRVNDNDNKKVEEIHVMFSFVCSLIMFTFCIFGSVGNLVSISIFTRRSMRSSPINILLTGLSGVDLAILIVSVLVYVVPGLNAYGYFGQLGLLQISIIFGFYQLGMIAQTCSVWTFVLISVERYLAVCFPLHVHRYLTVRRAKLAQLCLLASAIGYNFVRFWEYSLVYYNDEGDGDEKMENSTINNNNNNRSSTTRIIVVGYEKYLRSDYGYFVGYYAGLYILFHFLIPFPLITALNVRILKTIARAGMIRYSMTSGCAGTIDDHDDGRARITTSTSMMRRSLRGEDRKQQRRTTSMIALVTAVFAFCNLCPLMLNIWEAIRPKLFFHPDDDHSASSSSEITENDKRSKLAAYFILDISNVLVVFNSSVNPVIYAVFCRQYRRVCVKYWRRAVGGAGCWTTRGEWWTTSSRWWSKKSGNSNTNPRVVLHHVDEDEEEEEEAGTEMDEFHLHSYNINTNSNYSKRSLVNNRIG